MSCLSWNCRGLGNLRASQFLRDLVSQKKPNLLFLCETLCNKSSLESLRAQLGFEGCFVVEARGHSGGLALLWKEASEVVIQGFSFNHIDATVHMVGLPPWRFTGIYGEPKRELRSQTWDLFRSLKNDSLLPWCLLGDMNNLGSHLEKKGGRKYPDRLIEGFLKALDDCNLIDMPLLGYPFTWEKGRNSTEWIEERLDKALVTNSWLSTFPQPGSATIQEKIHQCGEVLGRWGRDITGNFRKRINECKSQIRNSKWGKDPISIQQHKEGKDKLAEVLAQKEIFWKQRSKQFWLNSGDNNSKYFHSIANSRKRNNSISRLQDSNGDWVTWETSLANVITSYFHDLFSSSSVNLGSVLDGIRPTVSREQNEDLLRTISEEEVRNALFQMHPDKSPGSDGMTPAFFQKHWGIVGTYVVKFVRDFFDSGQFLDSINDTHIVLIPKKKNPSQMGDLRPISLCNVIYKVASKVVANRMKNVLNFAISETQSAFVARRLISDNIMVAFEVMHYLKRKTTGKKGYMALKLDMSKAYDRVEWGFLEAILRVMGFNNRWIGLVLSCVNSVQYHVINSGQRLGPITPTRGIRQGCPLSPYLFIVCAEGFSSLIRSFESSRWLTGCKVARSAPTISHLLFADDSYIYCQATDEEASRVLSLLRFFEDASGQKVNLHKSSAFFSSNTSSVTRSRICNSMRIQEAGVDSTYLGLPSIVGRNKNAVLGFLKEKMRKRINSWEGKFLSRAGKEILIKSVVQSLPSYAMNVFLLPVGTCKELEKMMASFWWKSNNSSGSGSGIIWMNWDRLTKHKFEGGMGFRCLRDFNLAMLGKQGWRLLFRHESIVGKVFKARYYPHGDFLSAELGSNPSFVWNSIFAARDVVKAGLRKRIGAGLSVQITSDPWLPIVDRASPIPVVPGLEHFTVNSLFQINNRSWDVDVVRDLFSPEDASIILGIPLSAVDADTWYWVAEKNGFYSVRSAYHLLQTLKHPPGLSEPNSSWKILWSLKAPPKAKDLVWRAASNCLATKVNLCIKKVLIENTCPMCGVFAETELHVLVTCTFAWACWEFAGLAAANREASSLGHWLSDSFSRLQGELHSRVVMVCWAIWCARNDLIWQQRSRSVKDVVNFANSSLDQWLKAQGKGNIPLLSPLKDGDGAELWLKPSIGIKLNVDATIFESSSKHGFGCVVRDTEGTLTAAFAGVKTGSVSPELAEAMGIREALSWLKNHPFSQAIVETDSLVCAESIRSAEVFASSFGSVVNDCKKLLESLSNVSLLFVKRSANCAAHFVARHSISLAERMFSINSNTLNVQDKEIRHLRQQGAPVIPTPEMQVALASTVQVGPVAAVNRMEPLYERVACATFQFKEDALVWWDMVSMTHDVTTMTWEKFQEFFNAKYYNEAVRSAKRKEFTQLTQKENMSVTEYTTQFDRLARLASRIVPTNFNKKEKYLDGLNSKIRHDLMITTDDNTTC
ncbi:uncharacterized protein LOC115717895 [Cannabis sativa]|uniref:uncharacterized protein LOC115717895 n=1 Tax=Cannabis sativa TaxID=3483 RepID=UPI0029CA7A8A|nr:uncharacterized protein LOC115717895 [Cannabis sativa]